ncbi:hypothetical protein G9A89_009420 [Geosiphon pyriformis]|nr:hypothetical protein G9A89_009420 [Geosiphon pyriformis]
MFRFHSFSLKVLYTNFRVSAHSPFLSVRNQALACRPKINCPHTRRRNLAYLSQSLGKVKQNTGGSRRATRDIRRSGTISTDGKEQKVAVQYCSFDCPYKLSEHTITDLTLIFMTRYRLIQKSNIVRDFRLKCSDTVGPQIRKNMSTSEPVTTREQFNVYFIKKTYIPMISVENRRKRFAWTIEKKYWTINDWKKRDNAPGHKAIIAENFFVKMVVSRQSPDLNPIEVIWTIIEIAVRKRHTQHSSIHELEKVIKEEWNVM